MGNAHIFTKPGRKRIRPALAERRLQEYLKEDHGYVAGFNPSRGMKVAITQTMLQNPDITIGDAINITYAIRDDIQNYINCKAHEEGLEQLDQDALNQTIDSFLASYMRDEGNKDSIYDFVPEVQAWHEQTRDEDMVIPEEYDNNDIEFGD